MLLSKIKVKPEAYQFRERPYSERTVTGIVAEGINLAKFDPIPLLQYDPAERDAALCWYRSRRVQPPDEVLETVYVVAGDGHSRFEAIRRLADDARLPEPWLIDAERGEWDIPHRVVSALEAQRLAWTANLSKDGFTVIERARVYASMVDAGMSPRAIAIDCHTSQVEVTNTLKLNGLCHDIRAAIGTSPGAGGIDEMTGRVLATGFERFGIDHARQQQLWHGVLKHAMLNFQSAKVFIDSIGGRLAESRGGDDLLFALPANAAAVVADARKRVSNIRKAKLAVAMLLSAAKTGILRDVAPDLHEWCARDGAAVMDQLTHEVTGDGRTLAGIIDAAAGAAA